MIDVCVTNTATGSGEWLTLPATPEQTRALLTGIGVDGVSPQEYTLTDFHVGIFGISGLNETVKLDELNYFASLLDDLSFDEINHFEAAACYGQYNIGVKNLINLAQNLTCYEYCPGVSDNEELGNHLIHVLEREKLPSWIDPYFDYEAYGRDFAELKAGSFVDTGFVYRNDTPFIEYFNGRDIPNEYRVLSPAAPPEKLPIKERLDMYAKMADNSRADSRLAPDRDGHADR